jgi:hypothetical protein
VFNISRPGGLETHDCAAIGSSGSVEIPGPIYDEIGEGGSIAIFKRRWNLVELDTTAGPRAALVTSEAATSVGYLKPPQP